MFRILPAFLRSPRKEKIILQLADLLCTYLFGKISFEIGITCLPPPFGRNAIGKQLLLEDRSDFTPFLGTANMPQWKTHSYPQLPQNAPVLCWRCSTQNKYHIATRCGGSLRESYVLLCRGWVCHHDRDEGDWLLVSGESHHLNANMLISEYPETYCELPSCSLGRNGKKFSWKVFPKH